MTAKKHTLGSDAEEARIQKMIASDPDAPEVTPEQAAKAKPFTVAFPALAKAMSTTTEIPVAERIAALQREADKLGPADPDFDPKTFSDEMWGE